MTAARIRGGRRVTYREPKERERTTGYRHKGDSLTAVRLIGVTGWKINGLARVVQGWAKGAGRRRSRGMAPWQPPHTNSPPPPPFHGLSFSRSISLSAFLHFSPAVLVPLVTQHIRAVLATLNRAHPRPPARPLREEMPSGGHHWLLYRDHRLEIRSRTKAALIEL